MGDSLDDAVQAHDEMQQNDSQFSVIRSSDVGTFDFDSTVPQRATASRRSFSFRSQYERRNGLAPYLDIMTLNASQYPTMVANKDQQSLHTKLFVEPISVPVMKHTGIQSQLTHESNIQPLYYPDGSKRKNIRKQIQETLRTEMYDAAMLPPRSTKRSPRNRSIQSSAFQLKNSTESLQKDEAMVGNGMAMLALEDVPKESSGPHTLSHQLSKLPLSGLSKFNGKHGGFLDSRKNIGSRRSISSQSSTSSYEPISLWYQEYRKKKKSRSAEVQRLLHSLRAVRSRTDPAACY